MSLLVSIIIPCHNDYMFIMEAFASAVNQTYDNTEIIIVDDGSNAITKQSISKLKHDNLKIITQENQGLSAARNAGIKSSRGQYLLFLDSDDYFETTFLEKAVPILQKNNNVGVVTCYCRRFREGKTIDIFKPAGGDITNFLFKTSSLATTLIRRECFNVVGMYDEKMKNGYEDWEFYIRLTQKWNVHVIREVLYNYRQSDSSMRLNALRNHDKNIKAYIFKKHEKLYKLHFDKFIHYFLSEQESLNSNIERQRKKIDFKLGELILKPFRAIKRLFMKINN